MRKQLQNTIHGRQKPAGGKDLPGAVAAQKSRSIRSIIQSNDFFSFPVMNSPNLDPSKFCFVFSVHFFFSRFSSDQKGAYFRSQLSSSMSTPPLQTNIRSQQQQQQSSKTTM